jgi:hypothetical protein
MAGKDDSYITLSNKTLIEVVNDELYVIKLNINKDLDPRKVIENINKAVDWENTMKVQALLGQLDTNGLVNFLGLSAAQKNDSRLEVVNKEVSSRKYFRILTNLDITIIREFYNKIRVEPFTATDFGNYIYENYMKEMRITKKESAIGAARQIIKRMLNDGVIDIVGTTKTRTMTTRIYVFKQLPYKIKVQSEFSITEMQKQRSVELDASRRNL